MFLFNSFSTLRGIRHTPDRDEGAEEDAGDTDLLATEEDVFVVWLV